MFHEKAQASVNDGDNNIHFQNILNLGFGERKVQSQPSCKLLM